MDLEGAEAMGDENRGVCLFLQFADQRLESQFANLDAAARNLQAVIAADQEQSAPLRECESSHARGGKVDSADPGAPIPLTTPGDATDKRR